MEKEFEELRNALRDAHYSVDGLKGELPMFVYEYFAKLLIAFPMEELRKSIANDLYQRFLCTPQDGYEKDGFTWKTVKKVFSDYGVDVEVKE